MSIHTSFHRTKPNPKDNICPPHPLAARPPRPALHLLWRQHRVILQGLGEGCSARVTGAVLTKVELGQHRVDLEGVGKGGGASRADAVSGEIESFQHRVDLEGLAQCRGARVADVVIAER